MKKNIFYLFIVQGANYLFPLITLPYLLRVLGADNFGNLMLCQALAQYLILITEYGFNFSATKKIALAKTQGDIDRCYTETISAKILLLLVSFSVLCISITFIPMFKNIQLASIISFFMVVGGCFFPLFLFQGLEKMKDIVWMNLVAKLVMVIAVLSLVKDKDDLEKAAFSLALGYLIPSILSLYFIKKNKIVSFLGFRLSHGIVGLKESSILFISQMSISFYTTFNIILLGYFFSPTIVGYYSAADKLRVAVQSLFTPIQQVVFPRLNKERWNLKNNLIKFGGLFLFFSFFVSLVVFVFGQQLSLLYFGGGFTESAQLFKWMSILLFIVSVAIVASQWGLIILGRERVLTKVYLGGAVIHLMYTPFLVKTYGLPGMLGSVILTELILTIVMFFFLILSLKREVRV